MDKRVAVFRKEHFNAAHRLHNPGVKKKMIQCLVNAIIQIIMAIIMTW